jgi:glutathione synthase/RimK-type ligase-like ATP-grasp enzyme
MNIAIHPKKGSFSDYWIKYCEDNNISFKIVDCYKSDIIDQLSDCDALMWHFHHASPKDILFAKQLIYSIQSCGKKVFPDFNTMWHFDDKVGQKYLLEGVGAPVPASWVFYDKKEALSWTGAAEFPVVFKLRCGSGSQNVMLVNSASLANKLIRKAFSKGIITYSPVKSIVERIRLFKLGRVGIYSVLKGFIRIFIPPAYNKIRSREKGYVYFQEFVPGNKFDIRVVVIGQRAFAIQRLVRENDFRASGSGMILYEKELFDENTIKLSLEIAEKLKSQCVAFDFVYKNGKPLIVEINYGFSPSGYHACPGYWDKDLNWIEGKFNPYGWMVESLTVNNQVEKPKK